MRTLALALLSALVVPSRALAQREIPKAESHDQCPLGYVNTLGTTCVSPIDYEVTPTYSKACLSGWMNIGAEYCRREKAPLGMFWYLLNPIPAIDNAFNKGLFVTFLIAIDLGVRCQGQIWSFVIKAERHAASALPVADVCVLNSFRFKALQSNEALSALGYTVEGRSTILGVNDVTNLQDVASYFVQGCKNYHR